MPALLTPKQQEANRLLGSAASNIMLRGGSRSGKTFLLVRAICQRALNAPESRHAIWRFRFNHAKASIWQDTLPKVMKLCFPTVPLDTNETDLVATFPNDSQIVLGGLDDKARVEKVLGQEYATLYFNESSQIPWSSVETAMSRLAQNVALDPAIARATGRTHLPLKAYFDCVAGETILDGHTRTISELAEAGEPITVLTTHGPRQSSAPWLNGYGEVFTVTTSTGRTIRATASHRFWTPGGWRRLDQITIGHELLCIAEGPSRRGGRDALALRRTPQGSLANCCKCPRQCGGRLHPAPGPDQACPESASDGAQHTRCACRRDGSGSHVDHRGQREVPHSRPSQSYRGLLLQGFAGLIGRTQALSGRQTCGSSRQICPCGEQPPTAVHQRRSDAAPHAISRPRLSLAWYAQTALDAAAIGRQWARCNLLALRSLGRKGPDPRGPASLSLASDTPLIDSGDYEMVVEISQPTPVAYFTLDVPFSRHYLANGFVSHNCNPPSKLHWSYELFRSHLKPGTKEALPNPADYVEMLVNPADNRANLPAKYFDILGNMSEAKRLRFERGEWASEVNGALWSLERIDELRVAVAPDMRRIVVAVDPSGTKGDGAGDDIGIVVVGVGVDGRAYVLADMTCQLSPDGWGRRAIDAYYGRWSPTPERFRADRIVAERNFGGAMVEHVIRTADKLAAYKEVTASRGKAVRAEPISALYEQGLVSHVGPFPDLEDQMANMTAAGYVGEGSPDRADALVWALTELMLDDGTYDQTMGWV